MKNWFIVLCAFVVSTLFAYAGIQSYNADRLIFAAPSDFNGVVRVLEDRSGVRRMRFADDSTQSAYDTREPGRVVIPYIRAQLAVYRLLGRSPERVLVVGMGAGVLGMATRAQYPDAVIDLVDIDPAVVEVARRFMGFVDDSRMRVHVGDGRAFVQAVAQPYDVIFLDAYLGTDSPPHLRTIQFHQAVFRALRPGGLVSVNVLAGRFDVDYQTTLRTIAAAYPDVSLRGVPGRAYNRVLFAGRSVPRPDLDALGRVEVVDLSAAGIFYDSL